MAGDQTARSVFAWSVSHGDEDGFVEIGLFEGLGEIRGDSQVAATSGVAANTGGSEHQDNGGAILRICRNFLGQAKSIHVRHWGVEDQELKFRLGFSGFQRV